MLVETDHSRPAPVFVGGLLLYSSSFANGPKPNKTWQVTLLPHKLLVLTWQYSWHHVCTEFVPVTQLFMCVAREILPGKRWHSRLQRLKRNASFLLYAIAVIDKNLVLGVSDSEFALSSSNCWECHNFLFFFRLFKWMRSNFTKYRWRCVRRHRSCVGVYYRGANWNRNFWFRVDDVVLKFQDWATRTTETRGGRWQPQGREIRSKKSPRSGWLKEIHMQFWESLRVAPKRISKVPLGAGYLQACLVEPFNTRIVWWTAQRT